MHSRGQLHGEIKCDNIFYTEDGAIKLYNFGYISQLQQKKAGRGAPYWMAPEQLKKQKFDAKVDIWALGILIFEMIEKEPPYVDDPPLRALFRLVTENPPSIKNPDNWGTNLHDFLDKCLRKDPATRETAEQLKLHPFLQESCSVADWNENIIKKI